MSEPPQSKSPTVDEIAAAVTMVVIEVVAACSASTDEADERLFDVGSKLLDLSSRVVPGGTQTLLSAIAKTLVATENAG